MSIEIPLTQGKVALVSNEDADLARYNWSCARIVNNGHDFYYAQSWISGEGKTRLLHRVILERILGHSPTRKETVEHIDGNRLNNQRENLRYQTWGQMEHKKRKAWNNRSGYRGVYMNENGSFYAQIKHQKIRYHLGEFRSRDEAARAYDYTAIKLYGEHAKLNFPSVISSRRRKP